MRAAFLQLSIAVFIAATVAWDTTAQDADLSTLFATLGLTAQQRAEIDAGRPVAKVLAWGGPSEIFVFGAVHVNGSPAAYLQLARNISRLAALPGYLGIGELGRDLPAEELSGLTLEPDDIKALKGCREGACDVQLPTESIRAFHDGVDWSKPDAAKQANELARRMMLDLIRAYRNGGNAALGAYRDTEHPTRVADQFETLVSRAAALPDVLPDLRQYLLHYPAADLPAADSFFYWEKVNFGLKPTLRVNHAVIYSTGVTRAPVSVVAIKQLYASHYFHTALDVSVCVPDEQPSGRGGFYLLTLKGSEQNGLTGLKGSVLRKIVVDKTRSSLAGALASLKADIERAAAQN